VGGSIAALAISWKQWSVPVVSPASSTQFSLIAAWRRRWLGAVAVALSLPTVSGAVVPYGHDEFTLHLWHFDEAGPPFKDRAASGLDLLGLHNHAQTGLPSLAGLGTAVSFNHDAGGWRGSSGFKGAIVLAMPELADGPTDNVPADFRFAGVDGAFTYEALVRFGVLPADAGMVGMSLISMEGDSSSRRVFNFRIESAGFLAFLPLATSGGAMAAIPLTGPHAVNTTDWFHLAVTYDGNEGAANNLTLYWTRLDDAHPSAHLLGRGTMAADLGPEGADFAIGNEARAQYNNAEAEPFRGVIDEVRISSVARDPSDFVFVAPELRKRHGTVSGQAAVEKPAGLELSGMVLDGKTVTLPPPGESLSLPPGLHTLSFDFGIPPQNPHDPVTLRCRLKGLDERWNESGRGMSMSCEVLDEKGAVVSLVQLPVLGASRGWQTSWEDAALQPRSEPLHVPDTGRSVRITLASGADDTTGVFVIDDLNLIMKSGGGEGISLWENSSFDEGSRMDTPAGLPKGWVREGSAPTIARMVTTAAGPSLALVDGDQVASGVWTATCKLPRIARGGTTMLLKWNEMFNVIGGGLHRATFMNVPPGNYAFEAIAASTQEVRGASHVSLPFTVRSPITDRPWFWALVAALVVGSLAVGMVAQLRQQAARRLHRMRLQNALAQDRARIARDLHDDLGTRVTLLTMNVSLAQRDLEQSPAEARRHLGNLSTAARELVTAMDGMVWAVDPANDTLDHLGEQLARLAQEIFRDSPVRCLVQIPHVLPERTLRSDFRNHLALAVKEALHNILRHAGPCDATLALELPGERLEIVIRDTGSGFDPLSPAAGNGLKNLVHRLHELDGTCCIESQPGQGTCVTLLCPLPPNSGKPTIHS
jgi:signal transduction histidine kinase